MPEQDSPLPLSRSEVAIEKIAKYQVIVPLLSAAISVFSVTVGACYTAYQIRASQADLSLTEWRTALQQIKFEETSFVTSAFLLESYKGTPHEEQARTLQIAMLNRTSQPETFDLIFQDILSDTSKYGKDSDETKEVITDLLDVTRTINEHLETLWLGAKHDMPPNVIAPTYEEFLENPTPFFNQTNHADLNETLVLMYELDTFSNGMDCIWNTSNHSCPHLSETIPNNEGLLLMNYMVTPKSTGSPLFRTINTCSVHHAVGVQEFECK